VDDRLHLEVVTPVGRLLDVEVDEVEVPGALGALGVLPGHTALLSALGIGRLTYRGPAGEGTLVVRHGFVEVLSDRVTVLCERAQTPDEIDVEAARTRRTETQRAMLTASAEELEELAADLRMAETEIEVAEAAQS
jgi:F-type H+-transporting ATPase subunit epsilon